MAAPEVFGSYVLLKSLGRGAMGDVHLARPLEPDLGLPEALVVKRLLPELSHERGFVERFAHEAKIATLIESPFVARVFDCGRVGDTLYIAMELVDGWPLSRILKELQSSELRPTVASSVGVVDGALAGLEALHGATDYKGDAIELVHRDVSPKNLMLGVDGVTRVIDLGLGKSRLQAWKTATGAVMGAPGYMAPEQVTAEPVDARSDLYAVGIILWELLTMQRFISARTLPEILRASAAPHFVPPTQFRRDLPKGTDAVLARALAFQPDGRFQSAFEFRQAIRGLVPHADGAQSALTLVEEMRSRPTREIKPDLAQLLSITLPDPELKKRAQKAMIFAHSRKIQLPAGAAMAPEIVPVPEPKPESVRNATPPPSSEVSDLRISSSTGRQREVTPLVLGVAVFVALFVGYAAGTSRVPKEGSAGGTPAPAEALLPVVLDKVVKVDPPSLPNGPQDSLPRQPDEVDRVSAKNRAEPGRRAEPPGEREAQRRLVRPAVSPASIDSGIETIQPLGASDPPHPEKARAALLLKRALELLSSASPERQAQLKPLIARLSSASDQPLSKKQVDELDKRLSDLADRAD